MLARLIKTNKMLEGRILLARREDTISSILPSGIQYPPFWHLVSLCTHLNNTMLDRMPTSQYKKGVSYVLIIAY